MSILLLTSLASAAAPIPTTHRDRQLLISGSPEQVWVAEDDALIHLDPVDGHVIERLPLDPTSYGTFTVTMDRRKAHVAFERGSFDLDQVRTITLAPMPNGTADLLLTTPDTLTRVHPDGTQEAIRTRDIESVTGLPNGSIAYTRSGGDLVIHSPGAICTLEGVHGAVIAPATDGDPVMVRGTAGVLLVSPDCEPVGFAPLASRSAALTASGLWVLTDETLLHFARSGTAVTTVMTSTTIAAGTRAEACGDAPCLIFGTLAWNPLTGRMTTRPDTRRRAVSTPSPYTLVGTQVDPDINPYALRLVPGGTRIVNTATGHDVGVQIPRWARQGIVSADGRLALIVDDDGPESAPGSEAPGRPGLGGAPSTPLGGRTPPPSARMAPSTARTAPAGRAALPDPAGRAPPGAQDGEPPRTSRSALFEVATGREIWSFPALCNPDVLTATGFVINQGGVWYLIDSATGQDVYLLAREWPGTAATRSPWLDAVLIPAPSTWWSEKVDPATPPARRLGGEPLPAWKPVQAPAPADAGLADDPLRRATSSTSNHADLPNFAAESAASAARLQALASTLHSTAENPLSALLVTPPWPAQAEGSVTFATTRNPLKPGRSVAGLTGFTVNTNPVGLPLRAGRPTLVIIGPEDLVPERVLATAKDPGVDVLWASTEAEPYTRRDCDEGGLAALTNDHDAQQTVEAGDFEDGLAEKLGLPNPGAMLIGPDGRVLVEGTLEAVASALQWRNVGDARLPRPATAEWRYTGPASVTGVAALADGGVAFLASGTVGVLNADGGLRWSSPQVADTVATAGDRVITQGRGGIVARSATDGVQAWKDGGSLLAVGDTWLLADRGTVNALMRTSDGTAGRTVGRPQKPTARGDALWEEVADGWRCGVGVKEDALDVWHGCTPGDTVDGVQVGLDAGALTGTKDHGDVVWTVDGVSALRVDHDTVLAQLGSAGGPWATVDKRGKVTRLLLTDAAPSGAPGRIYGTVDGAIVAWRVK